MHWEKVLFTIFCWSQLLSLKAIFSLLTIWSDIYTRFLVVSEPAMTHLRHSESLTLGLKTIETPLFNSQNVCGLIFLHSDTNKSVFDWCKEGNVKKMDALLTRENINNKDEQVSC